MTCHECHEGLIPMVPHDFAQPLEQATFADFIFAVCLCDKGRTMRNATNNKHSVAPLWRVWCAKYQVDPSRVVMVEDVCTAKELAAAGFQKAAPIDREAALQAAGKKSKR